MEKLIISIVLSKNLKNLSISIHYLLFFSRDKYERKLTVEEADSEQSKLANKQKGMSRIVKTVEEKFFKTTRYYFLLQEKKFLMTLKAEYFQ